MELGRLSTKNRGIKPSIDWTYGPIQPILIPLPVHTAQMDA